MIKRLSLLAVISGLLTTACNANPQASEALPPPATEAVAQAAAEAVTQPTAETVAQPAAQAVALPTEDLALEPPPVKQALVATDPSTVSLASGSPQFVEFFAFW